MTPEEVGLDPKTVYFSTGCFYVYLLYRGEEPVYVGKGSGCRVGESVVDHRASHYEVVLFTSSEVYALLVERSLIQLIGVENLDNYHGGGRIGKGRGESGYNHTEEMKRYLSGVGKLRWRDLSDQEREAYGLRISRGFDDELRSRLAKEKIGNRYFLGRSLSEETRLKIASRAKSRSHSTETRLVLADAGKRQWESMSLEQQTRWKMLCKGRKCLPGCTCGRHRRVERQEMETL